MSARAIANTHYLIDQEELTEELSVFAHQMASWFARTGFTWCFAAKSTLALWLRKDRGIRGDSRRAGRRGLSTHVRRQKLTGQSILNRLRGLERLGLVEIVGGGRAVGDRYKGQRARGIRQSFRFTGKFRDALRGAYKPTRPVLTPAPKVDPALCGTEGCTRVPCLPEFHEGSGRAESRARMFEVRISTNEKPVERSRSGPKNDAGDGDG